MGLKKIVKKILRIPPPVVKSPFYANQNEKLKKYDIGDFTYGAPIVFDWGGTALKIGKFCSIADGVRIFLGGNHRVDWNTMYPFNVVFKDKAGHITGHPSSKGDVIIGNDVWIGNGATIMSGIHVGNGACIAANAVVAKDVPAYTIVAGNPAKVIRYRFSEEKISELENLKWWDWPLEKILDNIDLLMSGNDINSLLKESE